MQPRTIGEQTACVAEDEQRGILATVSYLGEALDCARFDTRLLSMPISRKGTLHKYVCRLHRLHDNKRMLEVYHCVAPNVRMLARMFEQRLKRYSNMCHRVHQ